MSIIPIARAGAEQDGGGMNADAGDRSADGTGSACRDATARIPSRERAAPRDEAELARRLAAGDPSALTEISAWLWEPIAAYAYRLLEDRDAAMDVAQESCLRLWDRRGRDPPQCIRAYLFRTARNLALDQLKTRRTRIGLLRHHASGRPRGPAWPDEALQCNRVATEVQRAIQELPERRREVFSLTYLQGLSYGEVAEILAISPKTVQNHMTSALAQLRDTLRPLLEERREERTAHDHHT